MSSSCHGIEACLVLFPVPVNTIFLKVIGVRKMSIIGTVLTLAGIIPFAFATKNLAPGTLTQHSNM